MRPIDVRIQKIVGTTLNTYGMIVAVFLVTNKANQIKFFKENFLVANISSKIVLEILFLTLINANGDFLD